MSSQKRLNNGENDLRAFEKSVVVRAGNHGELTLRDGVGDRCQRRDGYRITLAMNDEGRARASGVVAEVDRAARAVAGASDA